jgi:hypothetical protein
LEEEQAGLIFSQVVVVLLEVLLHLMVIALAEEAAVAERRLKILTSIIRQVVGQVVEVEVGVMVPLQVVMVREMLAVKVL